MKNTIVKINQDEVNALQARQVELEGYKNLWSYAVSNPPYPIPQTKIDELEAKVVELTAEYDVLKDNIQNKYVPKNYDLTKTRWNLDFSSCELEIVEND